MYNNLHTGLLILWKVLLQFEICYGIRPTSDIVLAKYDALAHNASATNTSQTRPGQPETRQTLLDPMSQRCFNIRDGNSSKTAEQYSQTIKRLHPVGELTTVEPYSFRDRHDTRNWRRWRSARQKK
jgi:hypothetical protein